MVPLPTDEALTRDSAGGPVPFADQVPATEQVLPALGAQGRQRRGSADGGVRRTAVGRPGQFPPPDTPVQAASTPVGSAPPPQSMGPQYRAVQRRFPAATGPQPAQPNIPPYPDGSEQTTVIPLSLPGRLRPPETRHDQTGL